MDLLTAFNFLEIQNAKDADKAARKLDDLKDEAEHLQKQGLPVKNWYEFKKEVVQEKPHFAQNILAFGGIGAAALGALAIAIPPLGLTLVPAVISGGVIGGMIGGYKETENSQHLNKVDGYEHYLEQVQQLTKSGITPEQLQELAAGAQSIQIPDKETPIPTVNQAAIIANSAKEKGHNCGCGHAA